jgi:hypothetical protein
MGWVHGSIFAGGGGHIPATWAEFAARTGVSAVLHLRPGRPAVFHGMVPEAFLWLDIDGEEGATLEDRWAAASFIDCNVGMGRRVLLHSSVGRHRTRWAFVAYRILCGQSVRAALREAAERPWLAPYSTDVDTWQAFAEKVRRHGDALSYRSA